MYLVIDYTQILRLMYIHVIIKELIEDNIVLL